MDKRKECIVNFARMILETEIENKNYHFLKKAYDKLLFLGRLGKDLAKTIRKKRLEKYNPDAFFTIIDMRSYKWYNDYSLGQMKKI